MHYDLGNPFLELHDPSLLLSVIRYPSWHSSQVHISCMTSLLAALDLLHCPEGEVRPFGGLGASASARSRSPPPPVAPGFWGRPGAGHRLPSWPPETTWPAPGPHFAEPFSPEAVLCISNSSMTLFLILV